MSIMSTMDPFLGNNVHFRCIPFNGRSLFSMTWIHCCQFPLISIICQWSIFGSHGEPKGSPTCPSVRRPSVVNTPRTNETLHFLCQVTISILSRSISTISTISGVSQIFLVFEISAILYFPNVIQ